MAEPFWEVLDRGSAEEVAQAIGTRIEQADWTGNLHALSEPERVFERVYSFYWIFGNGGLPAVFEVGGPYGLEQTADALTVIGQPVIADAIREALALPVGDADDRTQRIVERLRADYDKLPDEFDTPVWHAWDEVLPSLADYVRRNRVAFAHLAEREPFDPVEADRDRQRTFAERQEGFLTAVRKAIADAEPEGIHVRLIRGFQRDVPIPGLVVWALIRGAEGVDDQALEFDPHVVMLCAFHVTGAGSLRREEDDLAPWSDLMLTEWALRNEFGEPPEDTVEVRVRFHSSNDRMAIASFDDWPA